MLDERTGGRVPGGRHRAREGVSERIPDGANPELVDSAFLLEEVNDFEHLPALLAVCVEPPERRSHVPILAYRPTQRATRLRLVVGWKCLAESPCGAEKGAGLKAAVDQAIHDPLLVKDRRREARGLAKGALMDCLD